MLLRIGPLRLTVSLTIDRRPAPRRAGQAENVKPPTVPRITERQRAVLDTAPVTPTPRRRRRLTRSGRRLVRLLLLLGVSAVVLAKCGGCDSCSERGDAPQAAASALDSVTRHSLYVDSLMNRPRAAVSFTRADSSPVKNRILGVGDFNEAFPDMNDVQLVTASRLGISRIADRDAAVHRRDSLVYIGDNPYIHLQKLSHSIPYLVPRAERLLTEISRIFIDSLQRKGLPFYKPVVTSVLRTEQDVKRLRRVNGNASEQSCHRYGTTFDICYNHFVRVIDPTDPSARQVWDGRLKETLAEVLRDQRRLGTCYVRYERRQACFHITAR